MIQLLTCQVGVGDHEAKAGPSRMEDIFSYQRPPTPLSTAALIILPPDRSSCNPPFILATLCQSAASTCSLKDSPKVTARVRLKSLLSSTFALPLLPKGSCHQTSKAISPHPYAVHLKSQSVLTVQSHVLLRSANQAYHDLCRQRQR